MVTRLSRKTDTRSMEQITSASCADALISPEQIVLAQLRGFKETEGHPGWSPQLRDAWEDFVVRFARRLHQSKLDAILVSLKNQQQVDQPAEPIGLERLGLDRGVHARVALIVSQIGSRADGQRAHGETS
jgi:hypothetical protein